MNQNTENSASKDDHDEKFPLAPAGTLDVLDFLSLTSQPSPMTCFEGWVAGRIVMNFNSTLTLQSRGSTLSISLESTSREEVQNKLQHGDLIAIRLDMAALRTENQNGLPHRIINESVHNLKNCEPLLLAKSRAPMAYSPFDYSTSLKWNKMLQAIRHYFSSEDFIELDTPTLVNCPGTEPFLDVFSTEFIYGKDRRKFYLPTSPELSLKKALVRGWTKIFEMKRCFRNGELSDHHQSEFTMLEWYRAYERPLKLQKDFIGLLEQFHKNGLLSDIPEVMNVSMAYLFKSMLNFSLTPTTTFEELLKLCLVNDLDVHGTDTWDDLYHRIMIEKIEPTLNDGLIWIVSEFPPSQSAFARLTPEGWADRFEIYWKGLELANAFHELNDPEESINRQLRDLDLKRHHNKESVELDGEFQLHMLHGLPPTSGIALGVDRLFMVINDISEIGDTRLLPNIL